MFDNLTEPCQERMVIGMAKIKVKTTIKVTSFFKSKIELSILITYV